VLLTVSRRGSAVYGPNGRRRARGALAPPADPIGCWGMYQRRRPVLRQV